MNILARGPAAVSAYQQACNEPRGNAKLATRIRAVLVGQDVKERARLKRLLSSSERFKLILNVCLCAHAFCYICLGREFNSGVILLIQFYARWIFSRVSGMKIFLAYYFPFERNLSRWAVIRSFVCHRVLTLESFSSGTKRADNMQVTGNIVYVRMHARADCVCGLCACKSPGYNNCYLLIMVRRVVWAASLFAFCKSRIFSLYHRTLINMSVVEMKSVKDSSAFETRISKPIDDINRKL